MGKHSIIDWDKQPLGSLPDTELARSLHIPVHKVRYHRVKRGLPALRSKVIRSIVWEDQPLGQIPDINLSEKLNVSPAAVYKVRRKLGIPVFMLIGTCVLCHKSFKHVDPKQVCCSTFCGRAMADAKYNLVREGCEDPPAWLVKKLALDYLSNRRLREREKQDGH